MHVTVCDLGEGGGVTKIISLSGSVGKDLRMCLWLYKMPSE